MADRKCEICARPATYTWTGPDRAEWHFCSEHHHADDGPGAYAAQALARAHGAERIARELRAELDAARAELALLRPTQPAPSGGTGDVGQELLDLLPPEHPMRELVAHRRKVGLARYLVPVRRGSDRDHRTDLVEELLDAAVYALSVWPDGELARVLVDLAVDPEAYAKPFRTVYAENDALRRSLTEAAAAAASVAADRDELSDRVASLERDLELRKVDHLAHMQLHDMLDALDCGLPNSTPLALRVAWQLGAAREAS